MNFNILKFVEAKTGKVNPRAEIHGEERKPAQDINFVITVDPKFLEKLCVGDPPNFKEFYWTDKGEVRATGIEHVKIKREFDEHHMTISFSPLRDHDDKQRFIVKTIKVLKAVPVHGHKAELHIQIQHDQTDDKFVGWLERSCNSHKECYLQFEKFQTDLADQADEVSKARQNRRRKPETVPA